jgi:hypothetical protein
MTNLTPQVTPISNNQLLDEYDSAQVKALQTGETE